MTLRRTDTGEPCGYILPPEDQMLDHHTSQLAWALLDSLNAQIPPGCRFTLVDVLALAIHDYAKKRGLSVDES